MRISASLYSRSDRPIFDSALHLDRFGVDAFHIDCHDPDPVFLDLAKIRAGSQTSLDLHVISEHPEAFFPGLIEHQVEFAAFQFEHLRLRPRFPSRLVDRTQLGLAIKMDTDVSVFDAYSDECSFILLMTTVPGQSGGTFDPRAIAKIGEVRQRYPMAQIHVDGGVNQKTSEVLRQLDVEWAVSGSYLLHADSTPEALLRLRTRLSSGSSPIVQFMRKLNELPCISTRDARSATKILESIESRPFGFCVVVDEEGRLAGVVSDGDVRRGVLRSIEEGTGILPEWLVNQRPLTVRQDTTINQLFQLVEAHIKPFGFVPVNDNDGRLVGCVSLVDLMRGAS